MIAESKTKPCLWASSLAVASLLAFGCQKKSDNAQTGRPEATGPQNASATPGQDPMAAISDSALSKSADSPQSRMLGEDQQRELVGQLVALGLRPQASDSLFASISADSTQAIEFSQGEAEFDDKPGKETTSWWGFQSGSGDTRKRIYWLVISTKETPAKALTYQLITLPYCEASEQGTATLQWLPWEGQNQQALISKIVSLSCGTQIEGAQQIDTLRFHAGQVVYREGFSQSLGETDKSEIPE